MKPDWERVLRTWKEKIEQHKEYEIFDEQEIGQRAGRENDFLNREFVFAPYGLSYSEYEAAKRIKEEMLRKYEGKRLEEVLEGYEVCTDLGRCFCHQSWARVDFAPVDKELAKKRILSSLRLIFGIGSRTERRLKQEGFETIEDLVRHPRFRHQAMEFLKLLEREDVCSIFKWVTRWYSYSHPLVLYCTGFCRNDDFVFFDLETMGLFSRPIIVFGVARVLRGRIFVRQYILRDVEEEPVALMVFLSDLEKGKILVSYNGKSFDWPYIKERVAYYGMNVEIERIHLDIYRFARKKWKESLPDLRLRTLEQYLLNAVRENDVPGALVPEFYETYVQTNNIGPLIPIIEHNKRDLIVLARLFNILKCEWEQ